MFPGTHAETAAVLLALAWQDHAVIVVYLLGMIGFGVWLSRRQRTDEEYFLAGRRMPWFVVGMSVIASLLSSLTYISEPGEVWTGGPTQVMGKMLAIPFELAIVWIFCIPFMMHFRFTTAYEYLEYRFGRGTRLLGAVLFVTMVVLWMGFVVLASSRALAAVSQMPLWLIISTVGLVATAYTMLGGLRAVIWTDVIQVLLLAGGGLYAIGYVAVTTHSGLGDWLASTTAYLNETHQAAIAAGHQPSGPIRFFSLDPTVRTTVVSVAVSMAIWHICTHTANQMTVQRYYSTSNMRAARLSFLTGTIWGVALNLMLVVVGLALVHFYYSQHLPVDGGLNPEVRQQRDLIFPTFAVHRFYPGFGGALLAALLAAAMSSIDSGINSIATVAVVETHRHDPRRTSHVRLAMFVTAASGLFITAAAYSLSFLPARWSIVDAMPRTFNAITAPLGGLFLVGMFLPRVRARAAVAGTMCGLAVSILLGYLAQIGARLLQWGWIESMPPDISFNWIMPCALATTIVSALAFSLIDSSPPRDLASLTWRTRRESSKLFETTPIDAKQRS